MLKYGNQKKGTKTIAGCAKAPPTLRPSGIATVSSKHPGWSPYEPTKSPTFAFLNLARNSFTFGVSSSGDHAANSDDRASYGPCLVSKNTDPSAMGTQECHILGCISKPIISSPGPIEARSITRPASSNTMTSKRPRMTRTNSHFSGCRCGRKYDSSLEAMNNLWTGSASDSCIL